jgi:hypothetical protein
MQPLGLPIGSHVDGSPSDVAIDKNIFAEEVSPPPPQPKKTVVNGSIFSRKISALAFKFAAQQFRVVHAPAIVAIVAIVAIAGAVHSTQ